MVVDTAVLVAAHAATCRHRSPPACSGLPAGPGRRALAAWVPRRGYGALCCLLTVADSHRLWSPRKAAQKRSGGAFGKLGQLGDRLASLRGGAVARQPPAMHRRALLRRAALASSPAVFGPALLAAGPPPVSAAEPEPAVMLTDEEMAVRVRRKQELLRERQLGLVKGTDLPPDFNPEAGTNLRAKTIEQNLKESLEKQKEMKQRKTNLKRDDMCEMLGRGC